MKRIVSIASTFASMIASKKLGNFAAGRFGGLLRQARCVPPLDLALLATTFFMIVTDATVLLFHIVFVLLTIEHFSELEQRVTELNVLNQELAAYTQELKQSQAQIIQAELERKQAEVLARAQAAEAILGRDTHL